MDRKQDLFEHIDAMASDLTALSDFIFDHPEKGLEEHQACALLTDFLAREGFDVERGLVGMDTAFRASFDNRSGDGKGPSIGLLCEYDALEDLGHACGHHMQGPAIVGAASALKALCGDRPFRLVVYGTPAEETVGGKILMKERGCFQDIDVALMMHGSPTTTTDVRCLALISYEVTFLGRSAHAAIAPEKGRSALDALLLACQGIEFLREHVRDETRLHYTILDAGGPSNVIPARAKGEFSLRSYSTDYVDSVAKRVRDLFRGAALMAGVTCEIEEKPRYQAKIPVLALNELLMDNARRLEAPTLRPPREKTGSTDFGNVMYDLPGSCIRVAFVDEKASPHSEDYLRAGKSPEAHRCVLLGAKILAATCWDLVEREETLKAIQGEFGERKEELSRV
ncbi:M20 family metallopeptidase [Aminithiophilus ramosus]|uniref:Peptidase M20 domain-containing protein 2 n=1 Tax=Aminithiophilus ramosus TaxID=3029084 RepID=A0A9Q7A9X8_9BACT|nr:M20 family metallopeptidase [Aminithiophilus ramosus]QTX31443.1 M20 family metallopeptidase [Aminithiophilus ramosus]